MSYRKYYEKQSIEGTEERKRVRQEDVVATWLHWGPYLSDRQWGTVREWYGAPGRNTDPWNDFDHDQARSRAYRWGEDGLMGISDIQQLMCFSVALWNGSDPIIKERLFGHTNPQGNHGEDVKEYYFYLVNTPTHSYMKGVYKYPYRYPYSELANRWAGQNTGDTRKSREYELLDTGALANDSYFDVFVEYAKASAEDILIRITVQNQGHESKTIDVLPTIWFRNTWSWGRDPQPNIPRLSVGQGGVGYSTIEASAAGASLGARRLFCKDSQQLLFTNNNTNRERFGWGQSETRFTKDGINDYVVNRGQKQTVDPGQTGTKAAAHYQIQLGPKESRTICLRLSDQNPSNPFGDFDEIFNRRQQEANDFYRTLSPYGNAQDEREKDMFDVQVQAFAGMLWSKQFFYLIPEYWLQGDFTPDGNRSPPFRNDNATEKNMRPWIHMYCKDILSMPDKWEYPWFAAWDLAFHTTTLAIIDPEFAKHQLELLVMEYFQHPDGRIPAYEWDFGNINPPVHAWAAWQVYQTKKEIYTVGEDDVQFLERVFEKLNMNFTWWVNKTDHKDKRNVFEGGFLGLDNIRVVEKGPDGQEIEQADGTAWMAMFCLNMVRIACELIDCHTRDGHKGESFKYKDAARKYLQHFMFICKAMNDTDGGLWEEGSEFFMDRATCGRLNVLSIVGVVPLFAIEQVRQSVGPEDESSFYSLYGFLKWFDRNRPDLVTKGNHINLDELLSQVRQPVRPNEIKGTIAVVDEDKLRAILKRHVLDKNGFLSPCGVRGLSKYHLNNTQAKLGSSTAYVKYEPAESITMDRMGGNSNWCGPIWMPMNYLLIQSLRKFNRMLHGSPVDYPGLHSGGSDMLGENLDQIADSLSRRVIAIFTRDAAGRRPVLGDVAMFQNDKRWSDYVPFYEYFHGGDANDAHAGEGLGASHQTGWTGLVANLIQEIGVRERARAAGIAEDEAET